MPAVLVLGVDEQRQVRRFVGSAGLVVRRFSGSEASHEDFFAAANAPSAVEQLASHTDGIGVYRPMTSTAERNEIGWIVIRVVDAFAAAVDVMDLQTIGTSTESAPMDIARQDGALYAQGQLEPRLGAHRG